MGLFRKKVSAEIDINNIPEHIAIIPDGNRRWAAKRKLPKEVGHREGSYNFKRIVIECSKLGVKYITFYAFSTENWSRDKKEVDALMGLMLNFLRNAEKEIDGNNVVIRVIGDRSRLSDELKNEIIRVEKLTSVNTGIILNLAINYGGRMEITNAVKEIAKDVKNNKITVNQIDEELIDSYLYTKDCPAPDLFIRTSGEMRISNYLLWQMAYTELWFTDLLWPDFNVNELKKAIHDFQNRDRRLGG